MIEIEKVFTKRAENGRPNVIAGPCSAESREQVLEMAKALAAMPDVVAMRAGLWKPRTRPGGFEGLGEAGIEWLKEAQATYGIPVITEVAKPSHVELMLKADIKLMWIGARTTVNPFLIEELAVAMEGTGVSLLVKNPVSQDLPLWLGAIERFRQHGVGHIGAIHRGFSTFLKGRYRNPPEWQIAIGFKNRMPEVPLYCDPSHIAGDRALVPMVSQMAMDLNYDGLMIESHPNPDAALSDAAQQLTPQSLAALLANLTIRKQHIGASSSELEVIRNEIDLIDKEIVAKLGQRFAKVEEIAVVKQAHNIQILQMERWQAIIEHSTELGAALGIDAALIRKVYEAIHVESIKMQEERINATNKAVSAEK